MASLRVATEYALSTNCQQRVEPSPRLLAIAVVVWHVLHDDKDYVDFNPDCKAPAANG